LSKLELYGKGNIYYGEVSLFLGQKTLTGHEIGLPSYTPARPVRMLD
jgi:hypothetical protein